MSKEVLVIGGSLAGLQAALDLADAGIRVHLIEGSPFLTDYPLAVDRNGYSAPAHLWRSRILAAVRHPNINLLTGTRLEQIGKRAGCFHLRLQQLPRYVDVSRCTGCGKCIEVCPVIIPSLQGAAMAEQKAIHLDGEPGCAAIEKLGRSPCSSACPAGVHVQGYVALIAQKRFREAIELIRQALPFPSVCGRVCNHYCEAACTRGKVDAPVNIMALKRFVADWAYAHRAEFPPHRTAPQAAFPLPGFGRIAIIGSGPAGLTAARDLVRLGYGVTVFEALPLAGGMMRVGIPPHRLPTELLDWEIQQILDEGVELRLNTWVDDVPGLLEQGYRAVLIATGAHLARKLPLRNSNHPDNWLSLNFLRRLSLGEKIDLSGKQVVVLGGGNVALDTARVALRLGADEVRMACLEPRGEMPGFQWEIAVAEEEGITLCPGRTFKEIVVRDERIVGVRCVEVVFRGFKGGRPDMDEIPDTEHVLPADLVIWAIGQGPDFSFLPQDGSINTRYPVGIQSDAEMMTTLPGVFAAGDVRRGVTFFVVDAISEGHKAARSIDRYLRGAAGVQEPPLPPVVSYDEAQAWVRFSQGNATRQERVSIASIPLEARRRNFREVDLTLTVDEALAEARRCLACGVCSECLACVQVCKPGAVNHHQQPQSFDLEVAAILCAEDSLPLSSSIGQEAIYLVPPGDVVLASAVAARVMRTLNLPEPSYPAGQTAVAGVPHPAAPARPDVSARLGVFVCQCGGAISEIIDTAQVCQQASTWPKVIHSHVLPFSCSPEAARLISSAIEAHDLNRVVLAACSCCPLDQVCYSCTYQRVRTKHHLGIFAPAESKARFELVNLREQCAWVHAADPIAATAKAITMVAAAVARAMAAPISLAGARRVERSALVLGSGQGGQVCSAFLQSQGIAVQRLEDLPERVERAGGQFVVTRSKEETAPQKTWRASALVLSPHQAQQAQQLLLAFGRERRRPIPRPEGGGLTTRRPGVFYCDPTGDPQVIGEAAAMRLIAWLGRAESRPPIAAVVDSSRCRACKTCIEACEYGAPELIEVDGRYTSWIDPAICTGCGTCAAHCPSGAIAAGCSTDAQLNAMLGAILSHSVTGRRNQENDDHAPKYHSI